MNPFKIGDKVRCVNNVKDFMQGNLPIGEEFIIKSINNFRIGVKSKCDLDTTKMCPEKIISGEIPYWNKSWFELVQPTENLDLTQRLIETVNNELDHESTLFKVGDVVRNCNEELFRFSEEFTITSLDKFKIGFCFKNPSRLIYKYHEQVTNGEIPYWLNSGFALLTPTKDVDLTERLIEIVNKLK